MARLILEGFENVDAAIKAAKAFAMTASTKDYKVNMQERPWLQIAYDGDVTIKVLKLVSDERTGDGGDGC